MSQYFCWPFAWVCVPATDGDKSAETDKDDENADPAGEADPWDVEFQEEDYEQFRGQLTDVNGVITGEVITWSETSPFDPARSLNMHSSGDIDDIYYGYPDSAFPSHTYFYGSDGTFIEYHYLDNGYYGEDDIAYWGTTVYYKIIHPDGSFIEWEGDEQGNSVHDIQVKADGYYSEYFF